MEAYFVNVLSLVNHFIITADNLYVQEKTREVFLNCCSYDGPFGEVWYCLPNPKVLGQMNGSSSELQIPLTFSKLLFSSPQRHGM